jgi:hypothetical protein
MMLKHLTRAAFVSAALTMAPILASSAQAAGWESHNQPHVVRPYDVDWRDHNQNWRLERDRYADRAQREEQDRRNRYGHRVQREEQDRRARYADRVQREEQERRARYGYRVQREDDQRRERYREYQREQDRNDGPSEFLQNLFNQ